MRDQYAAPSTSWACSARCLARGERRGRGLVVGRVYLCVAGSYDGARVSTLDTEELPDFQRCATHLCEFGHDARQICIGHHERGWWGLGRIGG